MACGPGPLPRAQVAGEVRDARRVRGMRGTRAAWREGDLSPAHVRTLTRLAGGPRTGELFSEGEDLLVGEAGRSRFDDWQRLCAHWCDAADPDGPEQRRGRDMICAGSASVSGSTVWAMSRAISPRWPPRR